MYNRIGSTNRSALNRFSSHFGLYKFLRVSFTLYFLFFFLYVYICNTHASYEHLTFVFILIFLFLNLYLWNAFFVSFSSWYILLISIDEVFFFFFFTQTGCETPPRVCVCVLAYTCAQTMCAYYRLLTPISFVF